MTKTKIPSWTRRLRILGRGIRFSLIFCYLHLEIRFDFRCLLLLFAIGAYGFSLGFTGVGFVLRLRSFSPFLHVLQMGVAITSFIYFNSSFLL